VRKNLAQGRRFKRLTRLLGFTLANCVLVSCSTHRGDPGIDVDMPTSGYRVMDAQRFTPPDWPEALHATVFQPNGDGPHAAVLLSHGGGWRSFSPESIDGTAKYLAEHGFVVVNIEHRFAPEYRFPAQLHDVQQAMHWIHDNAERLAIDPDRIGAFGFSAGAHLLSLMALVAGQGGELDEEYGGVRTRPAAVVAGATPTDLRKWQEGLLVESFIGGTQAEMPDAYALASPVVHVHADAPPFFIFHGTWDKLVPTHHATDFNDALQSFDITTELYLQHLRGHYTSFIFRGSAVREGTQFLYRHLQMDGQ
jgi:acetyl esterase/lipase